MATPAAGGTQGGNLNLTLVPLPLSRPARSTMSLHKVDQERMLAGCVFGAEQVSGASDGSHS